MQIILSKNVNINKLLGDLIRDGGSQDDLFQYGNIRFINIGKFYSFIADNLDLPGTIIFEDYIKDVIERAQGGSSFYELDAADTVSKQVEGILISYMQYVLPRLAVQGKQIHLIAFS